MKNQKKQFQNRKNITQIKNVKKDHLINSRQVLFMLENGKGALEMDMENKHGQMGQSI
jgi:hypothetical protein